MRKTMCIRCGEYQEIPGQDGVVRSYTKPQNIVMLPVYQRKKVEGKQNKWTWKRVGLLCPKCARFEYSEAFKPYRHAV